MSRRGRDKRRAMRGAVRDEARSRGKDVPESGATGSERFRRLPPLRRLAGRTGAIVLALAVIVVAWRAVRYSLPGPLGATTLPPAREAAPVATATAADFVGAARCAGCHAAEYEKWSASTHGRAGGEPSPDLVIAAFSGRPIRFSDATVTPRVRAGTYEFVVARDGDTPEVVRVDGVIGGGHMEGGGTQGFVTRRPDGTMRFVPFDWSRHGAAWFCNTNSRSGRGWVPITASMRLSECGDWPPLRVLGDLPRWANCQSCHASQLVVNEQGPARETQFTSLAINCESCHGPGRRHVEMADAGTLGKSEDIGLASLRTLGKDASLGVCYQCHAVKDQLREGFVSGEPLDQFYSLRLPTLGDRPLHADGRVRTFAYQEAHAYSDCYINGGMTCTSCHDPHSQTYRTATGVALPGRFDDRQCTACHASKAERPAEHTHHAAGSAGSRCTACHMPYLQEPETTDPRTGRVGVRYARSDHSIAIPRPRADSALGVATACASCHATMSTARLEAATRDWWGVGKPLPHQVTVQLEAEHATEAARTRGAGTRAAVAEQPTLLAELLAPGAANGSRPRAAATYAGLARYFEATLAPDSRLLAAEDRARLLTLTRDEDVDIRALALATLHLLAGDDAGVRRELSRAAAREGARDFALRSRWAVALGYMADRYAESGEFSAARITYARALEVAPGNARLWQSRGNAERAAGDFRAAINSYEQALALEPASALTMVNLGIALQAAGDSARAAGLLRTATEADPGEPLGWFNLGNATLAAGDLNAAAGQFRRAIAIDGTLVDAHFQLARIHLLQGDESGALRALRRGLAVDSSNSAARELAARLSARVRE